MPTGYTAILFDKPDTSLRTFILRCSRAFGACIEMRDEDIDVPPPQEIKPSTYHLDALRKAEAEARELEVMTLAEAALRAKADHERAVASNAEYAARFKVESEVVEGMLAQVATWEAPSPDHKGLKDFMIDQLTISKPYEYQADAEPMTPAGWLTRARKQAADSIGYHAEHWKKEQEGAANRTAWLRALWASLPTGSDPQGSK